MAGPARGLLVGLPVIALGEAAGADARSRLRAAEANAAALGAERAAAGISDQLRRARDLIFAATQAPNTGRLPLLATAIRTGELTQMFTRTCCSTTSMGLFDPHVRAIRL